MIWLHLFYQHFLGGSCYTKWCPQGGEKNNKNRRGGNIINTHLTEQFTSGFLNSNSIYKPTGKLLCYHWTWVIWEKNSYQGILSDRFNATEESIFQLHLPPCAPWLNWEQLCGAFYLQPWKSSDLGQNQHPPVHGHSESTLHTQMV